MIRPKNIQMAHFVNVIAIQTHRTEVISARQCNEAGNDQWHAEQRDTGRLQTFFWLAA